MGTRGKKSRKEERKEGRVYNEEGRANGGEVRWDRGEGRVMGGESRGEEGRRMDMEELQELLDRYLSSGTFNEDFYSIEPARRLQFVEKLFGYLLPKGGVKESGGGFNYSDRLLSLLQ